MPWGPTSAPAGFMRLAKIRAAGFPIHPMESRAEHRSAPTRVQVQAVALVLVPAPHRFPPAPRKRRGERDTVHRLPRNRSATSRSHQQHHPSHCSMVDQAGRREHEKNIEPAQSIRSARKPATIRTAVLPDARRSRASATPHRGHWPGCGCRTTEPVRRSNSARLRTRSTARRRRRRRKLLGPPGLPASLSRREETKPRNSHRDPRPQRAQQVKLEHRTELPAGIFIAIVAASQCDQIA